MNLDELKNRSLLLFGKPRAFSMDEFLAELKYHNIKLVEDMDDDVVCVVDGKMMTPYEQNKSDELYKKYANKIKFTDIDTLENELAKYIDSDTLLMSLKLSKDKERLKSFIQNSCISDELFFRLLSMYDWGGEDFFENDDNRDVSAAIILRFYQNIEQNHNVQYATSGILHLIVQTRDERVIKAVFGLEPLQKSLKNPKGINAKVISAIATHPYTPRSILETIIKVSDKERKIIISLREDCDDKIFEALYNTMDKDVHKSLSYNRFLPKHIALRFIQDSLFVDNIAQYIKLDEELFKILLHKDPKNLAKNETLTKQMQRKLLKIDSIELHEELARNKSLKPDVIKKFRDFKSASIKSALYQNSSTPEDILREAAKDEKNYLDLAQNISTPKDILLKLSKIKDIKIQEALAANPNTPVEVLYQLQLDSKLSRTVKQNPSFTNHIKTQNLGWL